MRQVLGQYARIPAQELLFAYGKKGKPELSEPFHDSGIKFNLSHSHEVAILGVTRGLEIGVDVELVDPAHGKDDVAERFFPKLKLTPSGPCLTTKESTLFTPAGHGRKHTLRRAAVDFPSHSTVSTLHSALAFQQPSCE